MINETRNKEGRRERRREKITNREEVEGLIECYRLVEGI